MIEYPLDPPIEFEDGNMLAWLQQDDVVRMYLIEEDNIATIVPSGNFDALSTVLELSQVVIINNQALVIYPVTGELVVFSCKHPVVYNCTMGSHNFKGAANGVLRVLQRMSRDIRCNIYIAPELSREIQCNIYISPDVHVTVNIVAQNAIANNWTQRTIGYNSTRRAIGTSSTQRGKTSIQHAIGNTQHGKNRTWLAIGKTALEDGNTK